jgi:hypothetical protein
MSLAVGFRHFNSYVDINRPSLVYQTQPESPSASIGFSGSVSFTGIATVVYPSGYSAGVGTIGYVWYQKDRDFGGGVTRDAIVGSGESLSLSNLNSDSDDTNYFQQAIFYPDSRSFNVAQSGVSTFAPRAVNSPLNSTIVNLQVKPLISVITQPDSVTEDLDNTISVSPAIGGTITSWNFELDGKVLNFGIQRGTYIVTPRSDIKLQVFLVGGGGGAAGGSSNTPNTGKFLAFNDNQDPDGSVSKRKGGTGGGAQGQFTLKKGIEYTLIVAAGGERGKGKASGQPIAQGGYPGGGWSGTEDGGGGGGYSGIFEGEVNTNNAILIAGGGGGSGSGRRKSDEDGQGGNGGGLIGGNAKNAPSRGGGGGTQTRSGFGGRKDGGKLYGGGTNVTGKMSGGGGGAGWYGGDSGKAGNVAIFEGGGGGGSGYLNKDIVTRTKFCISGSLGGGTSADGSDGGDGSARFQFVGL